MVLRLLTWLSGAISSTPAIAIVAALLWGILSIVLSPCHLAGIPLIVGFIGNQGKISTGKAFALSTFFAAGILVTIALLGIITGMLGRILGDIGPYGNYLVSAIFFTIGLHLLGVLPLPFLSNNGRQPATWKKGLFAASLLGLIFGIALGPCTFAYMIPVLGVAFSVASTRFAFAAALVVAYAIGHCSVIVFAGTCSGAVQTYLRWNEKSKVLDLVKKVCGGLVVLGGIYLLLTTLVHTS
jgi:cytochrome c-type biogenesis protein